MQLKRTVVLDGDATLTPSCAENAASIFAELDAEVSERHSSSTAFSESDVVNVKDTSIVNKCALGGNDRWRVKHCQREGEANDATHSCSQTGHGSGSEECASKTTRVLSSSHDIKHSDSCVNGVHRRCSHGMTVNSECSQSWSG